MPNLENLRKQAKQYLRWHRERYYPVAAEIRASLPRFRHLSDEQILDAAFKLSHAQELVARQQGFDGWQALISGAHAMTQSRTHAAVPASASAPTSTSKSTPASADANANANANDATSTSSPLTSTSASAPAPATATASTASTSSPLDRKDDGESDGEGEGNEAPEPEAAADAVTTTRAATSTVAPTAARPTISSTAAQLFVADITASCDFYAGKLGFIVDFAYGDPPFYAQVSRDHAHLALRLVCEPVFAGDIREREHLLSAALTVETAAEVKQLFLEYQAAGVRFHHPLRKEPWGARTFIVLDPDDNLILFAGPAD